MSSISGAPPGKRELVYCHPCRDEWYRDEHGLVCPQCGGDFVEIIENDHDPRFPTRGSDLDLPEGFDIDDDDGADHHHHDHSPPAATFFRVEGHNFSFTSTQRIYSPRAQQHRGGSARAEPGEPAGHESPDEMMMHILNMFRNIVGDPAVLGERNGPGGTPGSGHQSPRAEGGEGHPVGGPGGAHTHTHTHSPPIPLFGAAPTVISGERWHYDSSARLNPRDADSPQPHEENVFDLHPFLINTAGGDGGNLLARVFGLPPGAEGDYVLSQADLDRVISQFMEQYQGNAPPPASKDVIDSLPKIKVTEQMTGDGVDCAVCKEDLIVEEEVTKLPCSHIYHFECVKRWLEAHDTCPICRHPATPENQRPQPHPPGTRVHTTPWPFPQRSQSSGPSQTPDHGNGNASGGSGGRYGWAALFRRRGPEQ